LQQTEGGEQKAALNILQAPRKACYQVQMRFMVLLVLPLMMLVQGCVCIHQSSRTATTNEIRQHLVSQLHCQALDLNEVAKDRFSGTGRKDTGEFTIEVQRQGELIKFHGAYKEPAKGTFSGSASWNKSASAFLGSHKSKAKEENSIGTP